MIIADAIWLATALLQQRDPSAADFSVKQIVEVAKQKGFVGSARPGLQVHASKHCVANKSANPSRHRLLFKTARGRRRLFTEGDPFHPDRAAGKIRPDPSDLPPDYQPVVDWYDNVYSKRLLNHPHASAGDVGTSHQFPAGSKDPSFDSFEQMRSETIFVGPGGTVVLPQYLQQVLGLKEGSCLSAYREDDRIVLLPITEDFLRKVRGSVKGTYSLLEDREREHRIEKNR